MIDFKYADVFKQNSVDIQLEIVSDDGKIHITNTEFHEEEFELTESLCSQSELTFGAVEAGSIKFKVSNIFLPMKGRWMTVKMIIGGHTDQPFLIGRFKVYSDTPTADRKYRDAVAYDALYDILNADVAAWYNTVFPSHKEQQKDKDGKTTTVTVYDPVTMKQFRDSFFKHFGIKQADIGLINDDMSIAKTIAVAASGEKNSDTEEISTVGETISGKEVLSCICETNGCMGHMGRDGKFHYIYLEQNIQGLYPRNDLYPADDLFPRDPKSNRIGKDLYITAEYEDFLVKTINKLQIREQKNDIGVIVGTGDNAYVIEDNFLVYGKGTKELKGIAKNILSKIRGIVYRPFTADCKGNPCLEVGDAVRLPTKYELIESYIFKRTLKGIQALRDDLETDGEEYRTSKANGARRSILQLKGKSNVLERTLEKTQSTIEEKEKGLISRISQTASDIRLEVKDTKEGLESSINQTASEIKMTVASYGDVWDTTGYDIAVTSYGAPDSILDSKGNKVYPADKYKGKYYLDQKTGYLYLSDGSSWNKVKELQKVSKKLEASINIEKDRITSLVSETIDGSNPSSLFSKITQTAESIKTQVAKAQDKWALPNGVTKEEILFGYGSPPAKKDSGNYLYYLNQDSGKYYYRDSGDSDWKYVGKLTKITDNLSSKIEQTAKSIKAEVSENYTTKGDMKSALELAADGIRSEVNASLKAWDIGDYDITYYGFGNPEKTYPASSYYNGNTFLNQNNGYYYGCEPDGSLSSGKYKWTLLKKFKQLASNMSSAMTQTAKEISTKVQKDGVISAINQTAESIKISAKKLNLDGNTKITGGTIHIETTESVDNIIQLKRSGTLVKMGNDGMSAVADTRSAIFQYSNITVQDTSTNTIAQMLSTGKGISSYGWESYSDRRLKHGIESLDREKSSAFILSLRPCRFIYNYDSLGHYRHGLIAQEVLESVGDEDWAVCSENPDQDGNTYYALDKSELIADLIATVQLQYEEIKELKETVGIL